LPGMPELPEVETVCRGLSDFLRDQPKIAEVQVLSQKLRSPIPKTLKKKLVGEKVHAVIRRAKYLLFETDNYTIINHLGMSGSWRMVKTKAALLEDRLKHDHCYITFAGGFSIAYNDPRRFGVLDITKKGEEYKSKWLSHLGAEPLSPELTPEILKLKAHHRQVPVKSFIMDQKIVVGVGNIYASEALFLAGVKPQRPAAKLTLNEWAKLLESIRQVLLLSIEQKGTTLRNYVQATGEAGAFQARLFVYDRETLPCRNCGQAIKMKRMAGRSTYWCKKCQK